MGEGTLESPESLAEIVQRQVGALGKGPGGLLCFSVTILLAMEGAMKLRTRGLVPERNCQEDQLQRMALCWKGTVAWRYRTALSNS